MPPQIEDTISHTKTLIHGVAEEVFTIDNFVVTTRRSHILNSKCSTSVVCGKTRAKYTQTPTSNDMDKPKSEITSSPIHSPNILGSDHGTLRKTAEELKKLKQSIYYEAQLCNFCKFDLILGMAHFPDMTYESNILQVWHRPSGLVLEFNVLDSLMPVIIKCIGLPKGMKVSPSEAWLKARMDCEYTKNVMNADFDWTFSSDYRGSFRLTTKEAIDLNAIKDERNLRDVDEMELASSIDSACVERIDIEKLKQRKQIHFYDEIDLFEDELADHGVAKCSVKIRVMSDSFFILLRYFLRVDNVFVRFYDTRIYHEFGWQYLIRERTTRDAPISDLVLEDEDAPHLLVNPTELYNHVPEKELVVDKIMLSETPVSIG